MTLEPIVMACPGEGGAGNLRSDGHAQCQYCNERLPLLDDAIPPHLTHDVISMIRRGDFDG